MASTDWLMATGWRQGLFSHCIGENAPTPLPFNVQNLGPDCYKARDASKCKSFTLYLCKILTQSVEYRYQDLHRGRAILKGN